MKKICVPTTLGAMSRLDTDTCLDGDLVEVELTQIEFDRLWESGFIDALNNDLGLMIDDFEDEFIAYENVDEAVEILSSYLKKISKDICFLRMKRLFELANDKNTGIYFYF